MNYRKLTLLLLLSPCFVFSQNIAINADGSLPDKNAMLDIKSENKGLLIPRVTTDARMRIPNTQGLMVYDVTTNSFWYNTGKKWRNLSPASAEIMAATGPWLLTGNAGTDNTNFLGTTDNAPLNIRVNNQQSGRIDLDENTFWGWRSGLSLTSGTDNTGIGARALSAITTGFNNTGIGTHSMEFTTTGFENTAIGRMSMYHNTTGSGNTACGTAALFGGGGTSNSAFGSQALGGGGVSYNTAVGSSAMWGGTSGSGNTVVGASAYFYGSQGSGNTVIGAFTMPFTPAAYYTTVVGYGSMAVASYPDTIINATVIGYNAYVSASNKVRIGNAAVTVIEGQVPFTTPSDGRFKFNVNEDVKGLDFILQLRPVTYQFNVLGFDQFQKKESSSSSLATSNMEGAYNEASSIHRSGFIAQEVEQAALRAGYNFSGLIKPKNEKEHYSLSYDAFVVPLVKAMQEQQQLIELLKKELIARQQSDEARDKKVAELQEELAELKKLMRNLK